MQSLSFWGWFQSLQPNEQLSFFGVAIGTVVAVTAIICQSIKAIYRHSGELALKREMLERGMNADEIATVIRATPARSYSRTLPQ
jgi:hypothetical protein